MLCCLPACREALVPENYNDLSTEELRALYNTCLECNKGRLIVHGLFARADVKNTNKRVYPKAILKREVARYKAACIRGSCALGELDHPSYRSGHFRHLNLPNISHQVLHVRWHQDELWGSIEILPTPSGLLLWELYSQGIKLGVSSRGWASLVQDPASKAMCVDEDFELITFDFVTEPSNKGAFLVPISTRYRRAVPDQTRGVAVAHLGLGAITMHNLPLLPTAQSMGRRVAHALWQAQKEEQRLAQQQQEQQQQPAQDAAGDAPGLLLQQQPRAAGSAGALGDGPCHSPPAAAAQPPQQPQPQQVLWVDPPGSVLMLGNHYITGVQSPAAPEGAAREYKRHLSEFATRAHLACSQGYTYPKGGSRSEPKQVGSIMADASSHQQQQQQQQPAGADACSDSSRTPGSAMAAAPAGPAALATEATAAALEAGPAALKAEQLRPPPPAAQPPQQPPQQATGERSWRGMLSTSQRVQPQELLPGMAEANTGASLEVACCSATEGQAQQQSCCDAGASGAGLECDTELGAASGGRLRHGSSSSVASHTLAGNPGIAMVASAGDAGSAASRSLAADAGGASAHASTPCQPPDKVQLPPGKPTTAGDPTAAAPLLDGQAATPAPSPGSTSPLYAAVKSTLLAYSRRRKAQQALMQGS